VYFSLILRKNCRVIIIIKAQVYRVYMKVDDSWQRTLRIV